MNAAMNKWNGRTGGWTRKYGKNLCTALAAGSLFQAAGCDIGRGIGNLFGNVIVGVMEVVEGTIPEEDLDGDGLADFKLGGARDATGRM